MWEYEPLLTAQQDKYHIKRRKISLTNYFLGIWALIATLSAIYFSPLFHNLIFSINKPAANNINVIFMVSDGMGPASMSLTRSFRQYRDQLEINDLLTLDHHIIGHSRTRSSDSLVTDSAAGATAFSCALKSYNGAIGVDADGIPCGSILEAAKLAGYNTGIVVTTRVTDATPACFASHVKTRDEEDLIADHLLGNYPLGRTIDLLIGGGRCHFLPKSENGGCRRDDRNLIIDAKQAGWNYIDNISDYNMLDGGHNVSFPLLALLSDLDIPFDLDRQENIHPSIANMTKTALKALSRASNNSAKGFFAMIEGSRIDHAGHLNDPVAQVHEILAYDAAFSAAIEFADQLKLETGQETLIISTSDHETGGLSVSRQVNENYPDYLWYPGILALARNSAEKLGWDITKYTGKKRKEFILHDIVKNGLGVQETKEAKAIMERLLLSAGDGASINEYDAQKIQQEIALIISERALIGWSTHGHSAVDVNIYGYSTNKKLRNLMIERLGGSNENTEIGQFLADILHVDFEGVTSRLRGMETVGVVGWWSGRSWDDVDYHRRVNPMGV